MARDGAKEWSVSWRGEESEVVRACGGVKRREVKSKVELWESNEQGEPRSFEWVSEGVNTKVK